MREIFAKEEILGAQDQVMTIMKSATDRAALNKVLQKAATDATVDTSISRR